jgi:hypothetical protein
VVAAARQWSAPDAARKARHLTARRLAGQRPEQAASQAEYSGARVGGCLRLRAAAHPFLAAAAAAPKARGSAAAVVAPAVVAVPQQVVAEAPVWVAAAEQEAGVEAVVSGAAERQPAGVAAALDAVAVQVAAAAWAVAAGPLRVVAAASAVAAERRPVVALDAAERRPVEVVALDAAERRPAGAARGVPAVAVSPASAAARPSFLVPLLFPAPSAPGPAVCFAHASQSLPIASRSERSRQAARDEIWSWRYRFPESSKG